VIAAVWRDVRYGVRMLARHPGFTMIAVVSLALGIGLNTAIFSIVNAVLLRPLAVDRPAELVAVYTSADSGDAYSSSSYPDFADLAANSSTLEGLTAHTLMFVGIDRGDVTKTTLGEIVSPNYFDLLGVHLAAGRGFRAGDERVTAPPTTVISSRMWQRDFGRDPNVIGRTLQIRGRAYAIVGVAPDTFGGLAPGMSAELWLPAGCVDDVEPVGMIDVTASPTGTNRIERRGPVLLWAVAGYGLATVIFGFSTYFWLTFFCLAMTGATDTISMIIRNIVRQLETPDRLRGRMMGVNMVFFQGGPQLGELEAGAVANWLGPVFSVVSGGVGCVIATAWVALSTPKLRAYRKGQA